MLNYDPKILIAFGETITGNEKIYDWMLKNGFPEILELDTRQFKNTPLSRLVR